MPTPITEDEFRYIKAKIKETHASGKTGERAARELGRITSRSIAKISIIAACKTFEEYKAISKAEHPPVKHSLGDRVTDLERNQENILSRVVALEERNGLTNLLGDES